MSNKIITEEMIGLLRIRAVEGMSEKRRVHTLAVERMAMRLGAIYAPDKINILRAAALLHDVTKEIKLAGQLELCEKYGIEFSENDKLAPKTFHAKTAAKVIEDRFPEFADDEIISAIRWHTTGREGMSVCEKIIYLADYIDDSRSFSDCVKLREFFWGADISKMTESKKNDHLRDTLVLSFDMTLKALIADGAPISEYTVSARNAIICKLSK
jgi:nicotinate-nucleotide adenylyltransferase